MNINVSEGIHTFRWEFDKDFSVSSGSDCAWIDFIVLPAPPVTTAYAGPDDEVCAGSSYQTDGVATLYNLVNWTTSGTGTFDDSQTLEAVYSPSDEDLTNGSVVLTLTAYSPDTEISDDMLLTIAAAPEAYAGEDMQACSEDPLGLTEAMATNATSVLWLTSGDGYFSDNQIVNPVYLPGDNDVQNGMVTLTFNVSGSNACDDAADDIEIVFVSAATATAGADAAVCSNGSYQFDEATAENYVSLIWTTAGDGAFDDETSLNPTYTPGDEDAANGQVTITLTATGNVGCGDVVSDLLLTVEQAPEAFAGEDNAILPGSSYTLADATAMYHAAVIWSTSGDGTFDDATVVNPTYTPGANDIDSKEVTLTLTAEGTSPCEAVVDEMMLSINTGIGENLIDYQLSVYPNPNPGNFTLELSGSHNEVISIAIYNALGNEVYYRENIEIDGSHKENVNLDVEQGIYHVRIRGEELLINRKIIIQK